MQEIHLGKVVQRLRPWLYLTAGGWSALLCVLITVILNVQLDWNLFASFLCGFIASSLFNIWFTYACHSSRLSSITSEISIPSAFLIHVFLFLFGSGVLYFLRYEAALTTTLSIVLTESTICVLSLFIGRIWIFVSPSSALVEYQGLDEDFYEKSVDTAQVGSFRAWYHQGRYLEVAALVQSTYKPGYVVYDFGSGGSEWNSMHLPVIGVDINRRMLEYGRAKGNLIAFEVTELHKTNLGAESADLVVCTEALEHVPKKEDVLHEIMRVLKPGGCLILTVPWDTIFSPFFWLFNVNCFYRGYVLGEEYHRQRCGHYNHFSRGRLRKLLSSAGFRVMRTYRYRGLLLYNVCMKPACLP